MKRQPGPTEACLSEDRMRARTAVCVTIAVIALAGVRARAVTLEDIVELSQAGIGEVVLIELVEMDDIAYPLTPSRLRALKGAGVSDQVLLALLRSGRSADDDRPAAARRHDPPRTRRSDGCRTRPRAACVPVVTSIVPVPVPVLVPTRPARRTGGRRRAPGPRTPFGFGGVSGFSFLSTLTTVTTGTAPPRRLASRPTGAGAARSGPAPGTDTARRTGDVSPRSGHGILRFIDLS